ncbi:MAG: hypothetical protein Q4D71_13390 [Oscillospiraceae bacterium]|nr:hypothetical protein [Oscillospiraceae bacterium]
MKPDGDMKTLRLFYGAETGAFSINGLNAFLTYYTINIVYNDQKIRRGGMVMDPENTRKETEKHGDTEEKRKYHKKNGRRIIFAVVLALILLWLLQFVSVMSDYIITLTLREMDSTFKAGITTAVDNVGNILDNQKRDVVENLLMDTHIKSTSLKNSFKDEASGKPMCIDDGFTVRVLDDMVVLPEEEGFGVPDELTPDLFSDEYGTFDTTCLDIHAVYAYSHISGDYYYVECGYNEWMYNELIDSLLSSVAKAYNRYIVFADKNDTVIYRSAELNDLTDKEFEAVMSAENEIKPIVYGSKTASVFRVDSSEGDYYAILFSPQYSEIRNTSQMALLVTLICVLLLGTIMVWLIEIRRAVGNTSLSKAKMEKYRPQIMKKRLMIISLLCMIIILAAGYVSNSIDNLYYSTVKAKSTLSSVSSLIDSTKGDESISSNDGRYDWTSKATAVADALSANPDLRNSKSLREFSGILYADYMIVYDHNGNELLTDSDYIGLSLGKDEKSQTYDFRKLLHGEKSIIHDAAPDEMSGEDMVLIGARMDSIEEDHPEGYNALVIAVRPSVLTTLESSIDAERLLDILGSEENVFCMINKEDKSIEFFTDYSLAGQNALDLGMEKSELHGGFMGVFSLNNMKYFGLSVEDDNSLIYYAIPATQLYEGSLLFGLINAVLFSLILLLMYRILMKG